MKNIDFGIVFLTWIVTWVVTWVVIHFLNAITI